MTAVLTGLLVAGCGPPPPIRLPGGAGTSTPGAEAWFQSATEDCPRVATWSAELGVSGRVRGRAMRITVMAGTTARGDLRLEGLAPFGGPVFVLVTSGPSTTLLLPREASVVRSESTAEVMEALIGVAVSGADLHALLVGCVTPSPVPANGRVYGGEWAGVDLGPGRTAYLRPVGGARRVVAATLDELTVAYSHFGTRAPSEITLTTRGGLEAGARLLLRVRQPEDNPRLDPGVFVVAVPPGTRAITIQELRSRGLGADGEGGS